MCYHNSLSKSAQELKNRYNAEFEREYDYTPIYHASSFARPQWPIVTIAEPESLLSMEWGFVKAGYISDEEIPKRKKLSTYNAKSETVENNWTFKGAFAERHRCLVPSTGFYEWRTEGGIKIPYFIHSREQEIFSMAGLYSYYSNEDTGENFGTFTILTCAANEMMMHIHNQPAASDEPRMPVLLSPENESLWLNPDAREDEIKALLRPFDMAQMKAHTIASPLKNPNKNTPTVIDFVEYPGAKIFG